jgi:WD40 repeat protein
MRLLAAILLLASTSPQDSVVQPWRSSRVRPLLPDAAAHSIHSYYVSCPESPDGRRVLFYASTDRAGYEGEVRILERTTGATKTLASKVTVEDAHRAACQQWISRGKRVVFHDFRDGRWIVVRVDVETLEERVLVKGRQVGFGAPGGDVVPIYGPHGDPGPHRDLELLNVETGEIRTVLTAATVKGAYPEWISKNFGERPISIFFPVLAPDASRVFFKLASPLPSTLDRRTAEFFRRTPSDRKGLLCYDLKAAKLTFPQPHTWGHPAWHPDGRQILEINHVLIDADTGATRRIPGLPNLPGGPHPSVQPAGTLFVTDYTPPLEEPKKGFWSLMVGDLRGNDHAVVHTFDMTGGAQSWRRNHPHPVFSPDGRRIYFNSGAGDWSRRSVVERTD